MQKTRQVISLRKLLDHPENPRKLLQIEDLTDSLVESGQLVSLLVRPFKNGYQIISGHRRKAALERAGFLDAECDIVEMDDEQAFKALMVTNIQSQTLSEVEEAEGIKTMMKRFEWTQSRVSQEFGKTKMWVSYRLSLLDLSDDIKESVNARLLTPTHGREIALLPIEQQAEVFHKVIEEKLSTRETAELVKQIINPAPIVSTQTETPIQPEQKQEAAPVHVEITINQENHEKEPEVKTPAAKQEPKIPTEYDDRATVSDYIYKLYKFINQTEARTIDIMVELGEANHAVAAIDKLLENLNWMRNQIVSREQGASGNVVPLQRKEIK